jgi:hypothetical protein
MFFMGFKRRMAPAPASLPGFDKTPRRCGVLGIAVLLAARTRPLLADLSDFLTTLGLAPKLRKALIGHHVFDAFAIRHMLRDKT